MNELWFYVAIELTAKYHREGKLPRIFNGYMNEPYTTLSYIVGKDYLCYGQWVMNKIRDDGRDSYMRSLINIEAQIPLIEAAKELLPYLHDTSPYKSQLTAYILASNT